ncbi:polymorphic toxin-type HINT domain-containing protein [Amycolatopsis xylanica]|uniref:polymorphic toxin-type HINT domain-containing protein n=1 Tax=Amycolatopsis xylanica TaxID=589385 RepID=UPI000B83AFBC|nr:polymorphic toxin-type HINT domain-containing protein [Amycolatopsis xylanica]
MTAVFAGLLHPPAQAAVQADPPPPGVQPAWSEPYPEWDGKTGLPAGFLSDPRFRQIVADNAELAEDFEVRDAAAAALAAGDSAAIRAFLDTGLNQAQALAAARKAEQARRDRAEIEPLAGTGGPYFNAEVTRVLAGTDSDRAAFLAYGKGIAQQRDAATSQGAQARATENRARVTMLVGAAGPKVKAAAQAALDAGDAAIAEFLNTGYLVAAKADADAREQAIKDQEARDKAAEELSELAKKSARASQARRNLLVVHGNGVNALERAANALVSAGTEARKAEQILMANKAGGQHPADAFNAVKAEVGRQLALANQASADAQTASVRAQVEANVLVETGLTYGVEWAQMAAGMAGAALAAAKASETASHAVDATAFTDQATNAQELAERHAKEAEQWRLHAQEHAKAAASIAEAARVQADAAKDAAVRTKAARQAAEAAEARAWAAAERTRNARITAEREAATAAAARATAERERAKAAAARSRAEQQAAVAHSARGEADRQAGIALGARQRAEAQDSIAAGLDRDANTEADNATRARDRAFEAERAQRDTEARAAANEAAAAAARGGYYEAPARAAADQARTEANTARGAATAARGAANTATGAAVASRAAATEATRAAARARAAAQQAAAAAARANAAANQAEAEAAATHAAALQANAASEEATAGEAQAAEASQAASALAGQAASESVQALTAAERTKTEADEAAAEAVSAATQASLAVQASLAARASSQAITDPANTAITVATPFTGTDLAADFVITVANQARTVGAEQAQAAVNRAAEAVAAAKTAADAATRASGEIKPAFDAAAEAAKSSADAAKWAADAQQAAADAATDGAAARASAQRANQADAQAHADAVLARKAANAANNDAAVAGRSAAAAGRDAAAARSAASNAEAEAAAARSAATNAENDATKAESAAASAQQHADNVASSAQRARDMAVEASKAADRAEEATRKAAQEKRNQDQQNADPPNGPGLPLDDELGALTDHGNGLVTWQDPETGIFYLNGVALGADAPGLRELIEALKRQVGTDPERYFPTDHPFKDPRFGVFNLLVDACRAQSSLCSAKFQMQVVAFGNGGPDPAGIGDPQTFLLMSALAEFVIGAGGRWGLKTGPKAPPGKPCNCFPAGTTVATDHGAKPIELIAVGDQVWARDLATGRSQLRSVVGLFNKHADQILTITTTGTSLRVTPQHPFWVVGKGWIDAGELRVGDRLSTLSGAEQPITAITSSMTGTTVYNFEVAGDHNYYITDAQLLVHNCDLNYHESPERGHTIDRHVAKDDDYLRNRGKPKASTFVDLPTAEHWTQANLDRNKDKVANFLSGTKQTTVIHYHFDPGVDTSKIGRIWVKETNSFVSPRRMETELIKDPSMKDGYYIKTSFLDF